MNCSRSPEMENLYVTDIIIETVLSQIAQLLKNTVKSWKGPFYLRLINLPVESAKNNLLLAWAYQGTDHYLTKCQLVWWSLWSPVHCYHFTNNPALPPNDANMLPPESQVGIEPQELVNYSKNTAILSSFQMTWVVRISQCQWLKCVDTCKGLENPWKKQKNRLQKKIHTGANSQSAPPGVQGSVS